MRVSPNFWGRCFKNTASVVMVLLSMTACAMEKEYPEKPPKPDELLKNVIFTVDDKGAIVIKDSKGREIGQNCSTDPKSDKVCSILKPGHKVEVKEISNITIIEHVGSFCVTLIKYPGPYASQVCR